MITHLQRQQRNQGVGASEVAAILGLDPYRSAWDLWALKTEKHIESGDESSSEAADIGNEIEVTTARLAEKRMGVRLVKPTATYKAANGIMFANLDRQVEKAVRGAENCELKSTGLLDGWGEAGTDDVPERVLLQVHAQMLCSDARVSHIARLLGRFGFKFDLYRVEYNPVLGVAIEERVCDWWNAHVVKDIAPEDSQPSLPVVSFLKRTPGKVIEIGSDVVAAYVAARDAKKKAEEIEDNAKANLLAALGDAEGGKAPGFSVSFQTINTKRIDTKALQEAEPGIAALFTKASGYRRLTVKEIAS